VPAVLVGALANTSRAQTCGGFHLITQRGPGFTSTFDAFANPLPAIIVESFDTIVLGRFTH
jgi:hypothetical protein